jgi:hypothetical protein
VGWFIEQIAMNHWSVGVRPLPEEIYRRILSLAGCQQSVDIDQPSPLPNLNRITIREATGDLLLPRRPAVVGSQGAGGRVATQGMQRG